MSVDRTLTDLLLPLLTEGTAGTPRPQFPGAVCVVDDGTTTTTILAGDGYRYADMAGTPVLPTARRPMHADTLFDCASLTKLFTATVITTLADRGVLGLDDRVGVHLPEFRGPDKALVTVRQLLSHTSGLPAEIAIWRDVPDPADRPAAVLACPLEAAPGSRFRYSCVGYITLGLLATRLTGERLDQLVTELVTGPLALADTGYRPLDRREASVRERIAATEMRAAPWSPEVPPTHAGALDHRGIVHDENAASLHGISGNAGIFAPAADLVCFGRAFVPGRGHTNGAGLAPAVVTAMLTPQLPAGLNDYQSGLGFRIDDASFMGALSGSGRAYGHTGFTGTSLVIDAARHVVVALCTNRVHPTREWSQLTEFRQQVHNLVAAHYRVHDDVRARPAAGSGGLAVAG